MFYRTNNYIKLHDFLPPINNLFFILILIFNIKKKNLRFYINKYKNKLNE